MRFTEGVLNTAVIVPVDELGRPLQSYRQFIETSSADAWFVQTAASFHLQARDKFVNLADQGLKDANQGECVDSWYNLGLIDCDDSTDVEANDKIIVRGHVVTIIYAPEKDSI